MMNIHTRNTELRSQREHYKAVRARLMAPVIRTPTVSDSMSNLVQAESTERADVPSLMIFNTKGTIVARMSSPTWTHLFAPVQPNVHFHEATEVHGRGSIVKMQDIVEEVCSTFKVSKHDLFSDRRTQRIILARHFAMWSCRNRTIYSYPVIGRYFRRDHTTVIHACGKIDEMLATGKLSVAGELLNGGQK